MGPRRPADRLGPHLRESYVAHVTRLDEIRDRAYALLDRNIGIKARRTVDVDVLDTKACQRVRQSSLDRRRTRVVAKPGTIRATLRAELDAQHVILAWAPPDSLGDQQLVVTHPIEVACVQQIQPGVERCVDSGNALATIRRPVHARHPHAAKTQRRDPGATRPQPTDIHETGTIDPNIETGALSSPTLATPVRRCTHASAPRDDQHTALNLRGHSVWQQARIPADARRAIAMRDSRSEEHTSELQSRQYLVCRLLLERKKKKNKKSR